MSFYVSFDDKWKVEAISYELGYSSLFECERIFITLKEYNEKFGSTILRLYDFSEENKYKILEDIKNGFLPLEQYYDKDCSEEI